MDRLSQVGGRKAGSISNKELAAAESQALSAPREGPRGEGGPQVASLTPGGALFLASFSSRLPFYRRENRPDKSPSETVAELDPAVFSIPTTVISVARPAGAVGFRLDHSLDASAGQAVTRVFCQASVSWMFCPRSQTF